MNGASSTPKPSMRRRRIWAFRITALLSPLLLLGALELGLRACGAFEGPGWENPYVAYEDEQRYFPLWDEFVRLPKPDGVYRIFALGGSTTDGSMVSRPFPAQLKGMLRERGPNVEWEVYNGGVIAMGSHRVYEVLREASRYDPDLFIVLMGNNEFQEDVTLDKDFLESSRRRLGGLARKLRIVRFVRSLLGAEPISSKTLLGRNYIRQPKYPLIHSREQYEARILFLEANVRLMIEFAREHGTEIVFVPAVPNLLYPPGDPMHGPGYKGNEVGWEELFARAKAECGAGRWGEAVEILNRLHEIDDRYAASRYLLGLAHLFARNPGPARTELSLASLYDQRGAHANPDTVDAILRPCRDEDVPAIDLRDEFDGHIQRLFNLVQHQDGRSDLWADHCHPTEKGHEIIARALAEFVLSSDR